MRYTATSIAAKDVIPAKAGIQKSTGFPRIKYGAGFVKPGMTKCTGIYVVMHNHHDSIPKWPWDFNYAIDEKPGQ